MLTTPPRVRANAYHVLTTPPRVFGDPKMCLRNIWTAPKTTAHCSWHSETMLGDARRVNMVKVKVAAGVGWCELVYAVVTRVANWLSWITPTQNLPHHDEIQQPPPPALAELSIKLISR